MLHPNRLKKQPLDGAIVEPSKLPLYTPNFTINQRIKTLLEAAVCFQMQFQSWFY